MIVLLLLGGLLAGPGDPGLWLERDGGDLLVTAAADRLADDRLRARLRSGLTTTLRLQVWLSDFESGELRGAWWSVARARWDLWEETLTVSIETAEGARTRIYPDVEHFLTTFARLRRLRIATGVPLDATVYQLRVRLELNPLSVGQQIMMRRWLATPGAPRFLDPMGSGLFGSFVRLFDNLKPGRAERAVERLGHPVRGDRLPFVQEGTRGPT